MVSQIVKEKSMVLGQRSPKNLYEYFHCSSKEELYKLLQQRDSTVKELIDFLEYSKKEFTQEFDNMHLNHIEKVMAYLQDGNFPGKEEATILMLDNSFRLLKDYKTSVDSSKKEMLQNIFDENSTQYIMVSNTEYSSKTNAINETLEISGFLKVEHLYVTPSRRIYSKVASDFIEGELPKTFVFREEKAIHYTTPQKIVSMGGYQEFMEHYKLKELENLHVIKDREKISSILKISNQHISQEHFSIIEYGDDFCIKEIKTPFIGTTNRALVDTKYLIPSFLKKDIKGVMITHNHPSGNPRPSEKDIALTKDIKKLSTIFEKELLDHLIVGGKGVFSFSKEHVIEDLYKNYEKNKGIQNYNCVTGNSIAIEAHPSGEVRWIAKKDIENYGIPLKEGKKGKTIQISHINEEKLYTRPITYYNVSDLQITKEIEQKFVPRKEKEVQQEKRKEKGMEIGD